MERRLVKGSLKQSIVASRFRVQMVALFLLHSSWGPEAKWLCNPVLSCHSCVLSWFACPVGVFIHYSGYHLFPFFAVGTVLLLGVLVGRLFCGWICPFGLLQDVLYKLPGRKFALPGWTAYIKYGVLAGTVVIIPFLLGEQTMYSFCRFCPASALQVTIPGMVQNGLAGHDAFTWIKLGILAAVLIFAILSTRSFCKVFCPIGAMMAPLNYITFWKIRIPAENCIGCRKCDRACPTNGAPMQRMAQGVAPNRAAECIVCHECQTTCPAPRAAATTEQSGD